ncbi:MAG: TonB-dependent receptor [Dysgonamonadaceae bacterium]|jgi:TonB-linked SusC/RagA family outer membrane protein|nr:TonB-dependent receptor [Dysgonamonadaceae bacterium]
MYLHFRKKATGILVAAFMLVGLPLASADVRASVSADDPIVQQTVKVTGSVVDATTGESLIGVNVVVKNLPSTGATTDVNGNFSLDVPVDAVLVVSYVGYTRLEITASSSPLSIKLKEDSHALSELVVVGYGTQRRESLTGALQTLKNDKIVTTTTTSVENMLSGKAPGVYVSPSSGQPGGRGDIIIRGKSSINGVNAPLWVIDGVIVGTASNYTLNPTDIETMTILKDAASTAIYGSQGANGVIVVTTKRASGDNVNVNFSAKFGLTQLDNGNMQVMNGAELYDYFNSFSNKEAVNFPRWNADLRNSNYSWWDLATQTGIAQDYNISISGGGEKMKSYFSIGYYNEEGAVRGYDFSRYSTRFRLEYKPLEWLTIKPLVSGSRRDVDDRQYSVTSMYSNMPWDNPYLPDGTPTPHRSATWVNSTSTNYLYDLQWDNSNDQRYSVMGNIDFDIRLTPWLTFSSINNLTWDNYASHSYEDPRSDGASGVGGRISEVVDRTERRYTNQILRYNQSFGKHAVSALAAYEFSDYYFKEVSASGVGFVEGYDVLDIVAKPEKTQGYINTSAIQSYLFNANYAYDDRYLAQVSARRDGASNFGENAKYGNFFSVSAGWLINKEDFFKADWVDLLKVRAAYGSVGNRPSELYPQYDLYGLTGQKYNDLYGALITQIGNKNLTWEKTYTTGIGVDFNFMERYRVNLDYYSKTTDNILFKVPVSGLIGVTSTWQNVGEMENKGFEVMLGADIVKTKDWFWAADFNLGLNRNKVTKLYGKDADTKGIVSSSYGVNIAGSISRILLPDHSVDTFYGREWGGVNPEDGAPQWYKTDDSGARVLTSKYAEADQVVLGSYNPDFYGGFSTNLSWKQLDLNAVFGYSVGGKIYNYSRQEYDSDGRYTDRNQLKLMDGWSRWQKAGDIATHPVATYGNQSGANEVSSRYLEDADYFKLRSVSLGYNLKLPQWKIPNIRLSFTAENLLTITGYSGVDPEISAVSGIVSGVVGPSVYPKTRKYMFGLSFTL